MVEFFSFCRFLGTWFRRVPIIVAQPYLVYSFFIFFFRKFLKNIWNFSNLLPPQLWNDFALWGPHQRGLQYLWCVIPLRPCNNIVFLYKSFNSISLWVGPILILIFLLLPPWAPKLLSLTTNLHLRQKLFNKCKKNADPNQKSLWLKKWSPQTEKFIIKIQFFFKWSEIQVSPHVAFTFSDHDPLKGGTDALQVF